MKYFISIWILVLFGFTFRSPMVSPVETTDDQDKPFYKFLPTTISGITYFLTPATLWVRGTTGSDATGNGTFNLPFATVTGAFNYFHANTTLSPVTVNVFYGTHQDLSAGISFTENTTDSSRQLTFKPYGGSVHFTGGMPLPDSGFHRPTDTTMTDRFQSGALSNIWVINLANQGVTPFGYGQLRQTFNNLSLNQAAPLELFINRVPQHLARWPNARGINFVSDSVTGIGGVGNFTGSAGVRDQSYSYAGMLSTNRPATWRKNNGVAGVFSWTSYWYGGTVGLQYTADNGTIDSINSTIDSIWWGGYAAHGLFATGTTGVSQVNGQQIGVYYYNIPEELDSLGEFYLDSAKNNLYVYCDSATLFKAFIQVSILSPSPTSNIPLLAMTTCANISFTGNSKDSFYFECSRGQGMSFTKDDNIHFQYGSNMNMGGIATVMASSVSTGNRNITFDHYIFTGEGQGCAQANGLGLAGNARTTLLSAGATFRNCILSNWCRNYRTSIGLILTGVGDTIVNCNITDAPGGAIDFQGNNHYIAYNRIQRVQFQFGDQGAIYTDRDPSSTGTIIYGNFFDSCTNIGHNAEISAVYIDDQSGGMNVTNNFFRLCGSGGHGAVHINGGGYNVFLNNTFYICYECFSGNGLTSAQWNSVWIYGADTTIVKPYVPLTPYAVQYPWFAPNFFSDTTFATNPLNNNVNNTLMYGSAYPTFAPSSGNWVVSDSGSTILTFKNAANGNYGVVATPAIAASWPGYINFNFDSTGIRPPIKELGYIPSIKKFIQTSTATPAFARLRVPHTLVTGTISNYVMTVITTTALLKGTGFGGTVTSRNNITFATNSNGSSLLKWEIVKYDSTTGAIEAYVQVPSINSSADTTIYMQYGNLGYSSFQGGAYGSVWGSNAFGIWHMDETLNGASTQTVYDWSPNGHNLASRGTWTTGQQAAGQVGGALTFTNSSGNNLWIKEDTIAGDMTLSGWFKITVADQTTTPFGDSLTNGGSGSSTNFFDAGYRMYFDYPVNADQVVDATTTSTGTWTYLVLTRVSGTWTVYHNGTSTATASPTLNTLTLDHIGRNFAAISSSFTCDEPQWWNVGLSPTWISTTYNNQTNLSSFPTITF